MDSPHFGGCSDGTTRARDDTERGGEWEWTSANEWKHAAATAAAASFANATCAAVTATAAAAVRSSGTSAAAAAWCAEWERCIWNG